MIRLAKQVLFFLLPLILFWILAEIYLRNIATTYDKKLEGLMEKADSVKVLVLGNSHACFGVAPSRFDYQTYNMAQLNQSLYFDKRIALKYLDTLRSLKFVLISIDYHSLYFSSQSIRDVWSYYTYGIEYKSQGSLITKYCRLKGYTPRVAFTFLRNHLSRNSDFNWPADLDSGVEYFSKKDNGWVIYEGTNWDVMNTEGYFSRALAFNRTVSTSIERNEVISDLEEFIRILKSKGVRPIFFTLPVYTDFRFYLDPQIHLMNINELNRLSQLYDVPYFNLFDIDIKKNNFYNCDHLNREGALVVSDLLNKKLMTLTY